MGSEERPRRYVGAATVGEWIGVSSGTVSIYQKRYAGTDHPCPVPDVVIAEAREMAGWLADRKEEWVTWAKNRPGQGAGGGRPRSAQRPEPVKPEPVKPKAKASRSKKVEPKAEGAAPPVVFSGK